MSAAGVATASAAYAQHEHPGTRPQEASKAPPPAGPVPPDRLGPGVVPVVTPDVPDMPWRQLFNTGAADRPDVLTAEIEARQLQVALETAQNERSRVWHRLAAQLTSAGNGVYKGSGTVGMSGDWDMTITATRKGQTLGTRKTKLTAH